MRAANLAAGLLALLMIGATPLAKAAGEESAGSRELFGRLDADRDGVLSPDEVPSEQRRLLERLLRRADADESGTLSFKEFLAGLTPATGDKPIEAAQPYSERGSEATLLLLLRLDTSGDARLTRDEAPQRLRPAFDQLVSVIDRDKDGELSRAELTRGGGRLSRQASQTARRLGWDISEELAKEKASQGAEFDRFDRSFDPVRTLGNTKEVAALFRELDANGDKQLRVDELPEPLKDRLGRLLRRADADRSGGVSEREFQASARRLSAFLKARTASPSQPVEPAMESTEGMSASVAEEESMNATDGSDDGSDDAMRRAERMIDRYDRDKDGFIARGEARGKLAKQFGMLDADGDGRLDEAELSVAKQKLADRLRKAGKKSAARSK